MHAGNISNAQTAGYKRREMSSVPFKELLITIKGESPDKTVKIPVGTGSGASFMNLDPSQGALKSTGATLDFGISGNGLFTLVKRNSEVNGKGEEYTSRNGRFLLDTDGHIINPEGDYLVDEGGAKIRIPNEDGRQTVGDITSRLIMKENGVLYDKGTEIARLKIQTDTNVVNYIPQLKMVAPVQQLAQRNNGIPVDVNGREIRVKQGFIEVSNVQVISEMIGLLTASKNYESGHKLITASDKVLDKAINELGRTG